jgi:hypothetical protein
MTDGIRLNVSRDDASARLAKLIERALALETRATTEVQALTDIANERGARLLSDQFAQMSLYPTVSPDLAADLAAIEARRADHVSTIRTLDGDCRAWYSETVTSLEHLGTGPQVLRRFQQVITIPTLDDPAKAATWIRDSAHRGANNLRGVLETIPMFADIAPRRRPSEPLLTADPKVRVALTEEFGKAFVGQTGKMLAVVLGIAVVAVILLALTLTGFRPDWNGLIPFLPKPT